ncbi:MAG TPA: SDR family NAD(P)-dependent oxidoreductase [Anaerolineales bacterium]|nr:SDR family NAD(P)-dependent oxidoreductase [Anaerolineales bacterium]
MAAEKSVVITGASTGIGRASALWLDARGWRVFAGVRNDADGASVRAEASERLVPLRLDVTDRHSIQRARATVEKAVGAAGLSGLVNNAGIGYGGAVEFLELDGLRGAFEVNFFGVIAVTQAFLPALRRGRGRIVNVGSISGLVAAPFLSPYSTSKWALEALSDALRVELDPWKIRVAVIEPGAIQTPIWDKGRELAKQIRKRMPPEGAALYGESVSSLGSGLRSHGISTQHVARAVEHALTSSRPRTRYRVGLDAALTPLLARLPDSWRDAFFIRRLRRGR